MVDEIGFIGLGLIGGSLAKALRHNKLARKIIAFDQDLSTLEQALEEKVIDFCATGINESFKTCDLIFLCCPVETNVEAYKVLSSIVKPTCIITDVGSTKKGIIEAIQSQGAPITFIGGHPMTGSEKSGYQASKASLFENAYYILSPLNEKDAEQIQLLSELIRDIRGLPVVISADQHDFVTATISHVPHIIAASLVNMVNALDSPQAHMHTLAAGGFKDITRIASSSPIMWQQICFTNSSHIIEILNYFKRDLDTLIESIQKDNPSAVFDFFERARDYRESFQEKTAGPLLQSYAITVDVEDKPGIIGQIATLLSLHDISIKNIGILNNREYTYGVLEIVFYDAVSLENSVDILTSMHYKVYKR